MSDGPQARLGGLDVCEGLYKSGRCRARLAVTRKRRSDGRSDGACELNEVGRLRQKRWVTYKGKKM